MPNPPTGARGRRRSAILLAALAAVLAILAPAPAASAAGPVRTVTRTTTVSDTPVLVSSMNVPPRGYRLTAAQVLRAAAANPTVRANLRGHRRWLPYEYTRGPGQWQVSWFSAGKPEKEMIQVYISDATGRVEQVWAGFQVAWSMARGYPGAFGRIVNAWYVWLPLCVLFVAPFVRRRLRQPMIVVDLLMLLSFSVSLAFFNHADIGLSTPLFYVPLIYLLVRMLLLAGGRGVPSGQLRTGVSTSWLGLGTVFLIAFRIGLNLLNSNVIDVGYSGVIGATRLIHGHPLYGNWPADNHYGDTYGPVSYYLYVPFRLLFGWSGRWDSLPAAHAAAIFFDLVTLGGLYLLGRRARGHRLGVILAYLWAAYPFTLYAMNSNTNDSLVAATIVLALLAIRSAPGRGVMAALTGMTKFAPLALAPLLLRGVGERPRGRSIAAYIAAFTVTVVVVMLPVVLHHDLGPFWRDSVGYQSDRVTPFSIYGLWGGRGTLQHLLQAGVIALGVGVALLPSRRGLMEVAALGAAVVVALQITLNYWLYPYIVWFFPLVIVALALAHPAAVREQPAVAPPDLLPAGHDPLTIRVSSS